jgi:small subunit ribosomal protein S4
MKKKISDYGIQLREKQKMKKIYGMLEQQFRNFFKRALKVKGITGEALIQLLERRLDNVVLKLLIVPSRSEARQFIRHGFIKVNQKKVDIPSYLVSEGDIISVVSKEPVQKRVAANLEMLKDRTVPEWLSFDAKTQVATVLRLPTKADAALAIEENFIVELYSK